MNDGRSESPIVLVTAAAGEGLGAAISARFARDGATVVVTDVHEARIRSTVARIAADHPEARVVGYHLDVGEPESIRSTLGRVAQEVGPVRVLVNNAAYNAGGTMFEMDASEWDRTVAVNLSGPWHLCRHVLPEMRANGGGVVVNISALASELGGSSLEGAYAITKGGLNTLTRVVAVEGAPFAIRAVSITLGVIPDTWYARRHPEILDLPFTQPLLDRPHTADIAEVVAFVASASGQHITGEVINVSGGMFMRP
jgi:NAD(P)-dependent dehydrogenase (short-subunit alcohol dehydrogenase family)